MTDKRMDTDATTPHAAMMLVAILTAVSLELARSTGPLLEAAFDVGVPAAAGTALLTYVGAGLVGLLLLWVTRSTGTSSAVYAGVIVLTMARLVAQGVTATTRVGVGLATISLSIAVLTMAVTVLAGTACGGRGAAGAVATGAALGVGMQLSLGTWDAYWRHDLLGWGVTVVVLACLVAVADRARRDPATSPTRRVRRVWALGPMLGLLVMVLANGGFASSQSDTRLAVAGPVAAVGLLLAGSVVLIPDRIPRMPSATLRWRLPVSLVPAAILAGVYWTDGPVVLVLLVAAQLSTVAVLAEILDYGSGDGAPVPLRGRDAAAASLVGLGTILPLLVFQLDYDIPLGFPNRLVLVATAAILGAAWAARSAPGQPGPATGASPGRLLDRTMLLAGAGLAVVGSVLAVGRDLAHDPGSDTGTIAGPLTLVSWNLHYGVGPDAGLNLEQIARSIEEHNPTIVTLQEVSRGWVLGGGADMATWLAQRLDMHVAYAPAADRQFGNVVLSNLAITRITATDLPYGEGPQERSAISVDLDLPSGPLRVTSVHLQNKGEHVATRLEQIDTLLAADADAPVLIIAGDFNSRPGSPEIDRMTTGTGLISAQDVSGDPTALTDPSTNPDKRIDWVFGRGLSFATTEVVVDALSSDHLPLVVVFTPE